MECSVIRLFERSANIDPGGRVATRRSRDFGMVACCLVMISAPFGCTFPTWKTRETCVLEPGISKDDLVRHLNRNVVGTETHAGLVSWRSGNAVLKDVTGIPFNLPAAVAVEAPRNFRLRVSNPLSGGQEVDIGSNAERFWIWTKDSRQMMTARHEDVPLALEYLNLPIHVQPDWLMEVFGVVPIQADEYEMFRPSAESPIVELVAHRTSPLGRPVERAIRVNVCNGQITEHVLRHRGGPVIARALLGKHTTLANGASLPMLVKLQWPEAQVEMTMHLGTPEANPAGLAGDPMLWQLPQIPGSNPVDIGAVARRSLPPSRHPAVAPVVHQPGAGAISRLPSFEGSPEAPPGRVTLSSSLELEAPEPASHPMSPGVSVPAADPDAPEWAKPFTAQKVSLESEDEPPSTYSPGAWRSSSDRPLPGPE